MAGAARLLAGWLSLLAALNTLVHYLILLWYSPVYFYLQPSQAGRAGGTGANARRPSASELSCFLTSDGSPLATPVPLLVLGAAVLGCALWVRWPRWRRSFVLCQLCGQTVWLGARVVDVAVEDEYGLSLFSEQARTSMMDPHQWRTMFTGAERRHVMAMGLLCVLGQAGLAAASWLLLRCAWVEATTAELQPPQRAAKSVARSGGGRKVGAGRRMSRVLMTLLVCGAFGLATVGVVFNRTLCRTDFAATRENAWAAAALLRGVAGKNRTGGALSGDNRTEGGAAWPGFFTLMAENGAVAPSPPLGASTLVPNATFFSHSWAHSRSRSRSRSSSSSMRGAQGWRPRAVRWREGFKRPVIMVLADSLRADVVRNATLSPHLHALKARLAPHHQVYHAPNHLSGGHLTQVGMFTALFGLEGYNFKPLFKAREERPEGKQHADRAWAVQWLRAQGYCAIAVSADNWGETYRGPFLFEQFDHVYWPDPADIDAGREVWELDAAAVERAKAIVTTGPPYEECGGAGKRGDHGGQQDSVFVFLFLSSTHEKFSFPPQFGQYHPDVPDTLPVIPLPKRWGRYRNSVMWLDKLVFGELVPDLHAAGAVVAVTGDHGEHFGEHGFRGHARKTGNWYQEGIEVPFVLVHNLSQLELGGGKQQTGSGPGLDPLAGLARQTGHIDIWPSLLDCVVGGEGVDGVRQELPGLSVYRRPPQHGLLRIRGTFPMSLLNKDVECMLSDGRYKVWAMWGTCNAVKNAQEDSEVAANAVSSYGFCPYIIKVTFADDAPIWGPGSLPISRAPGGGNRYGNRGELVERALQGAYAIVETFRRQFGRRLVLPRSWRQYNG